MYIAHLDENGRVQPLIEHLLGTAYRASSFADIFGKAYLGYICGLLHDFGKYSNEFQNRIKNGGQLCDHSTAGALLLRKFNEAIGNLLGYVITGHHSGLLNGGGWSATSAEKSLYGRFKKEIPDYSSFINEIDIKSYIDIRKLAMQIANTVHPSERNKGYCLSFLIRMIYSCLVDADFLDTEMFMKNGAVKRGVECEFSHLEETLENHTKSFIADTYIRQKRRQILEQCLRKAKESPGIFKLTVPTGGGKTISSMAFALRHIKHHPEIRRIIYVIPFTSIIEQNAKVFSDILGDKYILEHHMNFDFGDVPENEYNLKKLATENWDMPIIVTTNVQFFESLYNNKSSKLRKLHNIANSVIILDEVQMLPSERILPCVKSLEELSHNYNCTIVLCSATQPGIERFMSNNVEVKEICDNTEELYNAFNKTRVLFIGKKKMNELAQLIKDDKQCLIIVNTKKQASKLYEALEKISGGEDVFHLSTYMCPDHRIRVIKEIKERLQDNKKCIVVSTSLIEAGVDVDFPVVYRAMCGLDSIIQAAGRCNRERKHNCASVYVFDFEEDEYRVKKTSVYGHFLGQRQSITEIISIKYNDVTELSAIKDYYDTLFGNMDEAQLDKDNVIKRLNEGFDFSTPKDFNFDFEDIAKDFKIIEEDTFMIIIPFNDNAKKIIAELEYTSINSHTLRSLQKYSVGLSRYEYSKLKEVRAVKEYTDKIGILLSREDYSDKTGIKIINHLGIAEFL